MFLSLGLSLVLAILPGSSDRSGDSIVCLASSRQHSGSGRSCCFQLFEADKAASQCFCSTWTFIARRCGRDLPMGVRQQSAGSAARQGLNMLVDVLLYDARVPPQGSANQTAWPGSGLAYLCEIVRPRRLTRRQKVQQTTNNMMNPSPPDPKVVSSKPRMPFEHSWSQNAGYLCMALGACKKTEILLTSNYEHHEGAVFHARPSVG